MKRLWCGFFKAAITGALLIGWGKVSDWLEAGIILRTAGYVGISEMVFWKQYWAGIQKGAGAACMYFLLAAGIWSEFTSSEVCLLAGGFVLVRAFGALAAGSFPRMEEGGLPEISGKKRRRQWMLSAYFMLVLSAGYMCFREGIDGTAAVLGAWLLFFFYYWGSKKRFGGITDGSLHWFQKNCELVMAVCVYLTGKL